ncbi:reverse transcriptase domain-containing protein [Tanacetum coccineum]
MPANSMSSTGEVGYTTDECMHLKRKIEEMFKAEKLSHLIKELKQSNGKDQAKATKKGETSGKDKSLAILMEDGTEGPMIIEVEMGGNFVHRMYLDGGSSSEIMYEHCFSRFRPEVRSQMVPATTPLVGFSGEIIWPLGHISLLVKIGDEEHSTSAWMNFMVIRSSSPYNGIIGRTEVRRIQAVPSTAHGMLKFPVTGGTVTLRSSRIVPLECTMVSGPGTQQPVINQVTEEKIKEAIHPEYPEQTIQCTQEEFEFMAAADAHEETERVKVNCTSEDTLQQASTSGTQSDNAPVYDSDGSTEVPKDENCYDHDIFNMLTHEVQYTDLQTELDRTKEKLENCIIKKEKEYAVLWNNWYTKCEECKYDKISYDKAYNDMQQKIERLQAQLGDLKGKSSDTQCASNTLDLVSQKLKDENVSLES